MYESQTSCGKPHSKQPNSDADPITRALRRWPDTRRKRPEPSTLTFEWFGDEVTRQVIWYQVYENDEAFLTLAMNMANGGFSAETRRLLTQ